ncbi:MAG TPA: rhomboid family intramembrane serine protease [Myxococcota bacterium]|nr:rhomboid family intramembrane serine protease [Myxococcota bacterium]
MYGRGYGSSGMGFGPSFTPPIILNLVIANTAVFLLQSVMQHGFDVIASVTPMLVWQHGFLWQPFTYMWLHGNLLHLVFNMIALWMFGSTLAMAWGPQRFLRFYLLCGVGAGFVIATVPYLFYAIGFGGEIAIPTLGASGAIYGVLLAYSLTWPDRTIALLFPPVAFRAIWMIPIFFVMNLMAGGNVSNVGHLGGVLAGWIYMRWHGDAAAHRISWGQLKFRLKRWQMRRKLRAVQYQQWEEQRRREHDRRYH